MLELGAGCWGWGLGAGPSRRCPQRRTSLLNPAGSADGQQLAFPHYLPAYPRFGHTTPWFFGTRPMPLYTNFCRRFPSYVSVV